MICKFHLLFGVGEADEKATRFHAGVPASLTPSLQLLFCCICICLLRCFYPLCRHWHGMEEISVQIRGMTTTQDCTGQGAGALGFGAIKSSSASSAAARSSV